MNSDKTLAQKLRIKDGYQIQIVNAPENSAEIIGVLPANTHIVDEKDANPDFILIFAHNRAELETHFNASYGALKPDGLLWICYPKISSGMESDITRDKGWNIVRSAGLRPVAQIAVNETWSALRFRADPEKLPE